MTFFVNIYEVSFPEGIWLRAFLKSLAFFFEFLSLLMSFSPCQVNTRPFPSQMNIQIIWVACCCQGSWVKHFLWQTAHKVVRTLHHFLLFCPLCLFSRLHIFYEKKTFSDSKRKNMSGCLSQKSRFYVNLVVQLQLFFSFSLEVERAQGQILFRNWI